MKHGKSCLVGVELGGTWMRLALIEGGRFRRVKRSAPPLGGLRPSLEPLLSGRRIAHLAIGARGVWTPAERSRLARGLAGLANRVTVVSDAEAGYLAALGNRPGILIIAGTGSIAVGRDTAGRFHRAGGLGPILGDEGSGFWIGREFLKGLASEKLRRMLGRPDMIAHLAALAPKVMAAARRGDRRARGVLLEAQCHLAALVTELARAMKLRGKIPLALGGGLMKDRPFRDGVLALIERSGLGVKIIRATTEPAVALARMAPR